MTLQPTVSQLTAFQVLKINSKLSKHSSFVSATTSVFERTCLQLMLSGNKAMRFLSQELFWKLKLRAKSFHRSSQSKRRRSRKRLKRSLIQVNRGRLSIVIKEVMVRSLLLSSRQSKRRTRRAKRQRKNSSSKSRTNLRSKPRNKSKLQPISSQNKNRLSCLFNLTPSTKLKSRKLSNQLKLKYQQFKRQSKFNLLPKL